MSTAVHKCVCACVCLSESVCVDKRRPKSLYPGGECVWLVEGTVAEVRGLSWGPGAHCQRGDPASHGGHLAALRASVCASALGGHFY